MIIPFPFKRFIQTKDKTYVLPADAVGVPVEERYPGATLPASMKGARIYQTEDGPVIARPDSDPA